MIYLFASSTDFKNSSLTGAHKRFIELVNELSVNNKVILISPEVPQLKNNPNIKFFEIPVVCPNFLPIHIASMRVLTKKIYEIRKRIKYDYAVSFSPTVTICYGISGIKHITSLFRENLIEYQKSVNATKMKLTYFRFQECLSVIFSEKIIVQCKKDREDLIKRNRRVCKNISDKTFIQINNVNASWIKNETITREDSKDGTVRILFIGNFSDDRKGHAQLLPAVARLIDEHYNVELYIAGDGNQIEKYRSLYKKYERIVFLGRVSDMRRYLSVCDFEVVPSLIDSCPNTVLEGLNAGIAVYGANTGGIPDLLKEKDYLFRPDSKSIYIFLKKVINEKRYIKDAKRQSKRKEELIFDWCKRIQNIIDPKWQPL